MKIKVNKSLVPIKAHFFFFFAALGPILPQLNVFGRQLGVSAAVMGAVTAVLPLLWAAAKPAFGYAVDYWPNHRKLVFMLLIITMTGSYCGLWFIPQPDHTNHTYFIQKLNNTIYLKTYDNSTGTVEKFSCHWTCDIVKEIDIFFTKTTYVNTIFINEEDISCSLLHMDSDIVFEGDVRCLRRENCDLICLDNVHLYSEGKDQFIDSVINKNRTVRDVEYNSNSSNNIALEEKLGSKDMQSTVPKVVTQSTERDVDYNSNSGNNIEIQEKFDSKDMQSKVPKVITQSTERDVDYNSNSGNNIEIQEKFDSKDMQSKVTKVITQSTETDVDYHSNSGNNLEIQEKFDSKDMQSKVPTVIAQSTEVVTSESSLYMTSAFWIFVVLMCIGTVAFNVANCIGDAVCFDVLGEESHSKYGSQRAYGTFGYGMTALVGGWLVDQASAGGSKDFTPAFVIALVCTAADLYSCRKLNLPPLSSPADSGQALREVLKLPRVLLFIVFAVIAGTFDSFIIYYMFWFLEELAEQTGSMGQIKLIEGVVVAGQSFIGEIVFFALSGKIIKRLGYGTTMTLSLFCYGVRMALVSCIQHPWQLVAIESVMQGPTYALCYSAIVGYAAQVAPEGYSATVQGIVGGMDDGVGFAIGSLLGGQLYSAVGARSSFRILAAVACLSAAVHAAVFVVLMRSKARKQPVDPIEEGEKMLPLDGGAIYRATVVPLSDKSNR